MARTTVVTEVRIVRGDCSVSLWQHALDVARTAEKAAKTNAILGNSVSDVEVTFTSIGVAKAFIAALESLQRLETVVWRS